MIEENFFNIFNIPIAYDIDESELTKKYLSMQKEIHPDFSKNEDTKNISANLNYAYKILLNPVDRAEYFLKLNGVSISDELPSIFAEEMFELRQEFESLNMEEKKKDRDNFVKNLKSRKSEIISSLCTLENNLNEFKVQAGLLRFINSFLEKINDCGRN